MARKRSARPKCEVVRHKRTYGPADVAAALTACMRSGSLKAAERETGIAWETIRDWKKNPRWSDLCAEIRQAHAGEIHAMWHASARDAAEGLHEAILRCRQGLRKAALSDRDAALIGRTLAMVVTATQRLTEQLEADEPPRIRRIRLVTIGESAGARRANPALARDEPSDRPGEVP